MEFYRWFWTLLAAAALLWYSTITVYIAFKGYADIFKMLKVLEGNEYSDSNHQVDR